MAITLTNPTLSGTMTASEVEQNFTDIADKINTTKISDPDISEFANLAISKLAASEFVVNIPLEYFYNGTAFSASSGPVAIVPLPYSKDAKYTVLGYHYYCNDTGDGNSKMEIVWGYYDRTSGELVETTTIADETISNGSGANSENDANFQPSTRPELTWPDESKLMFIFLKLGDTSGANTVDSGGDYLSVNLRLYRSLVSG